MANAVNTPPTFLECLDDLTRALRGWGEGSYEAAEHLCRATRSTWAAYLDLWVSERRSCTPDLRSRFASAVDEAGRLVRLLTTDDRRLAALREVERERIPKFAASIEFRGKLLQILHEKGTDAVCAEIERRRAS